MLVDVQVAVAFDDEADAGVAGDLLEHVVEEAETGRELERARSRRGRRRR